MTDEMIMTPEQAADFWESHEDEKKLGIKWMELCFESGPSGYLHVERAANIIAERHGYSSNQVKNFRSCMRQACKNLGLDPLTIKKTSTGTSTWGFTVKPATKRLTPSRIDPVKVMKSAILKLQKAGKDQNEIVEAFTEALMP